MWVRRWIWSTKSISKMYIIHGFRMQPESCCVKKVLPVQRVRFITDIRMSQFSAVIAQSVDDLLHEHCCSMALAHTPLKSRKQGFDEDILPQEFVYTRVHVACWYTACELIRDSDFCQARISTLSWPRPRRILYSVLAEKLPKVAHGWISLHLRLCNSWTVSYTHLTLPTTPYV